MSRPMATAGAPALAEHVSVVGRPWWRGERGDAVVAIAFLVVNAIMQVLDAGATWIGLQLGGTETNPLMAALLATPGPALFFFVKGLVVLLLVAWAVWIAWRRHATPQMRLAAQTLAIAFTLVVAINVTIISKHIYGLDLY